MIHYSTIQIHTLDIINLLAAGHCSEDTAYSELNIQNTDFTPKLVGTKLYRPMISVEELLL